MPTLIDLIATQDMKGLLLYYGYGHIPGGRVDYFKYLEALELFLGLVGGLSTFVSFLVVLYQARKLAEDENITEFKRSWGWTIGSLFIPFINIVRPWLGFAEVKKSWKYAQLLKAGKAQINLLPFSWSTLSIALVFIFYGTFSKVYKNEVETISRNPINSQQSLVNLIHQSENLSILFLVFSILVFSIFAWYVISIRKSINKFDAISHHSSDQQYVIKSSHNLASFKDAMNAITVPISIAVYVTMAITQILAISTGIKTLFGISIIFSVMIAFFFGPLPLLGSVLGILGAMKGWGWSWYIAVAVFFWQYIFFLIIFTSISISDYLGKMKKQ